MMKVDTTFAASEAGPSGMFSCSFISNGRVKDKIARARELGRLPSSVECQAVVRLSSCFVLSSKHPGQPTTKMTSAVRMHPPRRSSLLPGRHRYLACLGRRLGRPHDELFQFGGGQCAHATLPTFSCQPDKCMPVWSNKPAVSALQRKSKKFGRGPLDSRSSWLPEAASLVA